MSRRDRRLETIIGGTVVGGGGETTKKGSQDVVRKFLECQSGATAIEYGLIAGMIGLAIITAVQAVGVEVQGPFVDATTGLQQRVSP